MATASERFVCVGRLTVPVEPVLLLLDLEARGFTLTRDHEDIVVRPRGQLTAEDRAAIRQWKRHVLALIDYCDAPPEVH